MILCIHLGSLILLTPVFPPVVYLVIELFFVPIVLSRFHILLSLSAFIHSHDYATHLLVYAHSLSLFSWIPWFFIQPYTRNVFLDFLQVPQTQHMWKHFFHFISLDSDAPFMCLMLVSPTSTKHQNHKLESVLNSNPWHSANLHILPFLSNIFLIFLLLSSMIVTIFVQFYLLLWFEEVF